MGAEAAAETPAHLRAATERPGRETVVATAMASIRLLTTLVVAEAQACPEDTAPREHPEQAGTVSRILSQDPLPIMEAEGAADCSPAVGAGTGHKAVLAEGVPAVPTGRPPMEPQALPTKEGVAAAPVIIQRTEGPEDLAS